VLALGEVEGDVLTEGLVDAEGDVEGETLMLGEVEALGEVDEDTDGETEVVVTEIEWYSSANPLPRVLSSQARVANSTLLPPATGEVVR
jgi:hypothetical protein